MQNLASAKITQAAFDTIRCPCVLSMNESMLLSAAPFMNQTRACMIDGIQEKSLIEWNRIVHLPKGSTVGMSGFLAPHDETINH
jgi:hypothetical protein